MPTFSELFPNGQLESVDHLIAPSINKLMLLYRLFRAYYVSLSLSLSLPSRLLLTADMNQLLPRWIQSHIHSSIDVIW